MANTVGTAPETDGRATRWDAHKAQRRTKVLDAAVAAIEEHGPGVGVKQIAEHARLPRSVVYRHFENRSDLDAQIHRHIVETMLPELVPTLQPDDTPWESIRLSVTAYLDWITSHRRLHAFLGVGSGHAREASSRAASGTKAAMATRVAEELTRLLRGIDKDTDLSTPLAFAIMGLVDATVNRWLADREKAISTDRLAEFLTRSIWYLLDGNLRTLGLEIDPHTPLALLLDE